MYPVRHLTFLCLCLWKALYHVHIGTHNTPVNDFHKNLKNKINVDISMKVFIVSPYFLLLYLIW